MCVCVWERGRERERISDSLLVVVIGAMGEKPNAASFAPAQTVCNLEFYHLYIGSTGESAGDFLAIGWSSWVRQPALAVLTASLRFFYMLPR